VLWTSTQVSRLAMSPIARAAATWYCTLPLYSDKAKGKTTVQIQREGVLAKRQSFREMVRIFEDMVLPAAPSKHIGICKRGNSWLRGGEL